MTNIFTQLARQRLAYLSDISGHRRSFVKSESAAEILSNLYICGRLTAVISGTVGLAKVRTVPWQAKCKIRAKLSLYFGI